MSRKKTEEPRAGASRKTAGDRPRTPRAPKPTGERPARGQGTRGQDKRGKAPRGGRAAAREEAPRGRAAEGEGDTRPRRAPAGKAPRGRAAAGEGEARPRRAPAGGAPRSRAAGGAGGEGDAGPRRAPAGKAPRGRAAPAKVKVADAKEPREPAPRASAPRQDENERPKRRPHPNAVRDTRDRKLTRVEPALEYEALELDEPGERADNAIAVGGIVALVGRPNVGKSTLFNRLVGSRAAIVHDEPGVTRDRHYGDVTARGRRFTLVDTGGFDPESTDPMKQEIKKQIDVAVSEADVIVCVLDAMSEATAIDHAELELLRRSQKPIIYVANKADSSRVEAEATDLYRLGMDKLLPVSAAHGRNISELEDAILAALPPPTPREELPESKAGADDLHVAVIGKPNAGKSSLINRLAGEERMLVDDRPGTTRDPIDTVIERNGQRFVLVDTAGIRRKAKVVKEDDVVEVVSVLHAIRAMERSEVVLLMCDAAEGVAEQDAKILGLAVDRGRGVVIALNKTDKLDRARIAKLDEAARDKLSFALWAPIAHVSALTGRGVGGLLETVKRVGESFRKRVPTAELNRFFEQVLLTHPPPTSGGRAPRLFFITQAEASPPLFVIIASDPSKLHFSYRRYVMNQIRQTFGFEGVPVRVKYKERRRRSE